MPTQVSSVTSHVWSSTVMEPDQVPTWAKRQASRMALTPTRMTWAGSSTAGNEPVQVMSTWRPSSGVSHTMRTLWSGSMISMR